MLSARSCTLLLLFAMVTAGAESSIRAAEFSLNSHTFVLPDGFVIEQVAGPPLVDRPITAAFDEKGCLYVTDSSGSNDKPDKQLIDKPHRVVRLEDSDGDGTFDKRTIFADKMMFPEGTMWLDGSVYVAAPPSIWKLTDTNDDGVADERVEWFQGKTLTGCANDLHGPYLGPDGWIYWAKGAFAEQKYDRPGKKPLVTKAAHIFRSRPDGSGIEPVMTGGMDNPVDVVFTPGGERIFTTTFLQNPGGGRRDGLIHAIYGGVYGKIHDPMEHAPRTGDILPTLVHLGPAAPCGLVRVESKSLGAGYENNLFACQFNRARVSRHALKPSGATFASTDDDFVVSKNMDFHPTDVIEDADGSLVILDTGGWYKLCCPTSQLPKPDVLGAIYRVRRKDGPKIADARGRKIEWAKLDLASLAKRLGDDRPAVRNRAADLLVKSGGAAVPALATELASAAIDARLQAVWTLTRIEHPDARKAVRTALRDGDETVRQAAIHSAALWRDAAATPLLVETLSGGSAQNERAAAEALGRIGDKETVEAILKAASRLGSKPSGSAAESGPVGNAANPLERDRILEHSLTFALIEIGDVKHSEAAVVFGHDSWLKRAALISLDQMEGGSIHPDVVAKLLVSPDPVIKDAASWIIGRHPDWGSSLVALFREKIAATDLSEADVAELEGYLAKFALNSAVQELLAASLRESSVSSDRKQMMLRAIRTSGVKIPESWREPLASALKDDDNKLVHEAVRTIRALPAEKETAAAFKPPLLAVAQNSRLPADLRLDALAAIAGGLDEIDPGTFGFLRQGLNPENSVLSRSAAADVLAKSRLTSEQLSQLADAFATTGPLEADKLLGAYELSTDESVGTKLISALKSSPALTSLRVDSIRARIAKQSPSVKSKAEELYAIINVDIARQKQKLEELLPSLAHGDVRRGQEVFRREKSACITCHGFGYVGGNVGPDLTRIGGIRTERDLLEAILFPSASFVRSFEPVTVVTVRGKSFNGVVKKDAADEVVLATTATEVVRIPRDDIEEMVPSSVSVMPAGLDKQLSTQDLADLIAFLKNAK
ncbi:MAG: PVC-type heme-binding CxxCH protein [Planctomycetaceae bacterium]